MVLVNIIESNNNVYKTIIPSDEKVGNFLSTLESNTGVKATILLEDGTSLARHTSFKSYNIKQDDSLYIYYDYENVCYYREYKSVWKPTINFVILPPSSGVTLSLILYKVNEDNYITLDCWNDNPNIDSWILQIRYDIPRPTQLNHRDRILSKPLAVSKEDVQYKNLKKEAIHLFNSRSFPYCAHPEKHQAIEMLKQFPLWNTFLHIETVDNDRNGKYYKNFLDLTKFTKELKRKQLVSM